MFTCYLAIRPRLIAGPEADAEVIELVRKQLGLDQPLHIQFWHYMTNVLQGDFGTSMVSRRPVSEEIASRFMPSLWLTIASMAWAVLFGMTAGIIAAVWRNRWPDRLSMTLAVTGISFPAFALGMLLMQIFSVELGWLPTVGADTGSTISSRLLLWARRWLRCWPGLPAPRSSMCSAKTICAPRGLKGE